MEELSSFWWCFGCFSKLILKIVSLEVGNTFCKHISREKKRFLC